MRLVKQALRKQLCFEPFKFQKQHTLAHGLNGTCLEGQPATFEIIIERTFDDDAFSVFGIVRLCSVKANARQLRILVFECEVCVRSAELEARNLTENFQTFEYRSVNARFYSGIYLAYRYCFSENGVLSNIIDTL